MKYLIHTPQLVSQFSHDHNRVMTIFSMIVSKVQETDGNNVTVNGENSEIITLTFEPAGDANIMPAALREFADKIEEVMK